MEMIFKEECYQLYGCIFEVNRKLGSGFLEGVYQEAMEIELAKAQIPFKAQREIQIVYDGIVLKHTYKADIICYDKIVVELKAVSRIINEHKAQLMNYLAATGFKLGLLVNFAAHPKAEIIRIVR
jgi:GxxExxY protein